MIYDTKEQVSTDIDYLVISQYDNTLFSCTLFSHLEYWFILWKVFPLFFLYAFIKKTCMNIVSETEESDWTIKYNKQCNFYNMIILCIIESFQQHCVCLSIYANGIKLPSGPALAHWLYRLDFEIRCWIQWNNLFFIARRHSVDCM